MLWGWQGKGEKMQRLADSSIFILPSFAEGLPNSLMESMASGLACISTEVGAVGDLVIDNQTGLIIKVNDKEAIKTALTTLLNDTEKSSRLARMGYEMVNEKCSININPRQVIKIIETCAG